MSNFTSVELDQLTAVSGGASVEGSVQTPVGSGNLRVDTATAPNPQASDPSAYLRCLDLVGKQGGMFEAPNAMEARQERLCSPLLNGGTAQ
jgi:hypothetical protein